MTWSAHRQPRPAAHVGARTRGAVPVHARHAVEKRATEQNQLLLAFPGITYESGERCTLGIMNAILGGSASSRLYRRLRDELGLCYDLETFDMTWADTGLFGIGAATSAENEPTGPGGHRGRAAALPGRRPHPGRDGPGPRAQAESGAVLALESTLARMRRLGQGELLLGRAMEVDELLERYSAVTAVDVLSLARRLIDFRQLSVTALGDRAPARGVRRTRAVTAPATPRLGTREERLWLNSIILHCNNCIYC